jgi:branched-chain amino acid transport system ATP-binding protein
MTSSENGNGRAALDAITEELIPIAPPPTGNGHGDPVDAIVTLEPEEAGPTPPAPKPKKGLRGLIATASDVRTLRRYKYGALPAVIFALSSFFQSFDTASFGIAGPEVVREFKLEITTLFQIQQLVGFFAVFATIFFGWYLDRRRRLPYFAGGMIASGVTSMATAGATSALTLGAPRVLDDVADRASQVPQFSLLADYYPFQARGKAFAILGMATNAGALLALPVAGLAITYIGLRPSFIIFGAPMVITGVIALISLREPVRGYFDRKSMGLSEELANVEDEPMSFGESWRTTWSVRTMKRAFFGFMIITPVISAYGFFQGFFLFEQYGLNAAQRGIFGVPAIVAALMGGFLGGGLVDRWSVHEPARVFTVFGGFLGIMVVGFVAMAAAPPLYVLLVIFILMAFGTSMAGPAFSAVISQVIPPSIRTQGLQVFALHQLPGLLIGFGIYNSIYNSYGYQGVWLTSIPVLLTGIVVFMSAGSFFELDRRNASAAAIAGDEWRKTVAAGQAKLLVCRDIDVEYDGVQVLFGVDFDVDEGEIIALLGTNGAGKSTLLRAISGTQEASGGAILFDGRDITHMPPHEIAQRQVIHMPGGRGIFPGLSVKDNLLLGAWMLPDDERDARVAEAFDIFPVLRQRETTDAGALSGGEQQQLSLAQAFLGSPKLLMIDELSLVLSPAVVGELLEKVRAIHARGTTIIIVEQSVNVALTLASRAIFMEKGEVKFFGETEELLRRPDILRAVYVKGTGSLTGGPVAARRTSEEQRRLELESASAVLRIQGITKRYGGVTAIDDVSFDVREGSVLGVVGPNGSGKTTMFEVISGFQKPDAGTITYDGQDITGLAPEEIARRRLVRRFQQARLFPSLTVYETLLVALDQRMEVRSSILHAVRMPQARASEGRARVRADALIELLELGSYRDKFIKELSTGLRRIVDIACVLATNPKVLLLDEPSSGIAQSEAEGLAPLLRRIRHETDCTMLVIEHDMPLLSRISDEMLVLNRGTLLLRGDPQTVLNDERVIEAYLGTSEEAVKRSGGMQ